MPPNQIPLWVKKRYLPLLFPANCRRLSWPSRSLAQYSFSASPENKQIRLTSSFKVHTNLGHFTNHICIVHKLQQSSIPRIHRKICTYPQLLLTQQYSSSQLSPPLQQVQLFSCFLNHFRLLKTDMSWLCSHMIVNILIQISNKIHYKSSQDKKLKT